jgi:hypothetical protein
MRTPEKLQQHVDLLSFDLSIFLTPSTAKKRETPLTQLLFAAKTRPATQHYIVACRLLSLGIPWRGSSLHFIVVVYLQVTIFFRWRFQEALNSNTS